MNQTLKPGWWSQVEEIRGIDDQLQPLLESSHGQIPDAAHRMMGKIQRIKAGDPAVSFYLDKATAEQRRRMEDGEPYEQVAGV